MARRPRPIRRPAWPVALASGLLLVLALPATAEAAPLPPPSLTGETLIGTGQIDGECSTEQAAEFTFGATGTAVGPYEGTFTETGSYTLAPAEPDGAGALQAFTASFSIESPVGRITGSKVFDPIAPQVGRCFGGVGSPGTFPVRWEATIESGDCRYTDRGRGNASLVYDERVPPGELPLFSETFTLSDLLTPQFLDCVAEPPPAVPTSAEQCRDGGFRDFLSLAFRNQGDCVSFVRTGGRNEPGQNVPN